MAAVTADVDRDAKGEGRIASYGINAAETRIYKGCPVSIDASGYAVAGDDTTTTQFVGIAVEGVTVTSGGSDGDFTVRVYQVGDFLMGWESGDAAITQVDDVVYIATNNDVEAADVTTNDIPCGVISKWVSTSEVWVRIDGYAPLQDQVIPS